MDDLSRLPLEEIIGMCEGERAGPHSQPSPACVELFRRAFAGQEECWTPIYTIFASLMYYWADSILRGLDVEDTIQIAFFKFTRNISPSQRATLVATDEIAPVLAFLRTCVRNAASNRRRAENRRLEFGLDDISIIAYIVDLNEAIDNKEIIKRLLAEFTENDIERIVFEQYFSSLLEPRKIYDLNKGVLKDVKEVNKIVQRLSRRVINVLKKACENEQEILIFDKHFIGKVGLEDLLLEYPDRFTSLAQLREISQKLLARIKRYLQTGSFDEE